MTDLNTQAANARPLTGLQTVMGRKPRLLLVDDQVLNIQALHLAFASDCQVFMATSGEQALQLCLERQPDLVLMDVEMPDLSGLAVCQRMQADQRMRNIPVIFVTAHSDPEAEMRGLDAGAVDFIAKPFSPAVVRARVRTHLTVKAQSDLLRELAFVDGLTGVNNRRYFDERLAGEFQRAKRNGGSLCLLMVDVDHFKLYNDTYGHLAGDDCLRRVAECLQGRLRRPPDVICRYGGEEFACILPDTELAGGAFVAGKILTAVQRLGIVHKDAPAQLLTVSIGVSGIYPAMGGEPADLLALADRQLYETKAQGRNQVSAMAFGPTPEELPSGAP